MSLARCILMEMVFFEKCEWMELALDCVQWRALLLAMLKLRFLVIDTSIVSYWR